MAVAVDSQFFATLPTVEEVDRSQAELAWLVYDLRQDAIENRKHLALSKIVYTQFNSALDKITKSEPGDVQQFVDLLQEKLDKALTMGNNVGATPDTVSLQNIDEIVE